MHELTKAVMFTMFLTSCSGMDVESNTPADTGQSDTALQGDDLIVEKADLAEDATIDELPDNDDTSTETSGNSNTEVPPTAEPTDYEDVDTNPIVGTPTDSEMLIMEVENANAKFRDPESEPYDKVKKNMSDFEDKLDSCVDKYAPLFEAHIKYSESCEKLEQNMDKNKFTLVKRCLRLEYRERLADSAKDRLNNVIPRGIERINRLYRKAQLNECNLGAIPDQSQVDYVFNGSVEIGELDSKWAVKEGSEIPGWAVRFYDPVEGVVERKGLLELQSNSLYRQDYEGSDDRHYMELDSHCSKGYNCPTTNVSIRQKIFIDSRRAFVIDFEARMRNNNPADNAIEVKLYKQGTKQSDRTAIVDFVIVTDEDNPREVETNKSIPVSTTWERYETEVNILDPGTYFLEINEIGKANQLGTLIDNISIKQKS